MNSPSPAATRPLDFAPISLDDLVSAQNACDRDKIGSLARRGEQDRGFLLRTHRQEAKQCLFDLSAPNTPDAQKIKGFFMLQGLAGGGYQDRFQHTFENGQETYAWLLDGDESGEGLLLTRQAIRVDQERVVQTVLEDRQGGAMEKQLKKDIGRGGYLIGGQLLGPADVVDIQEQERTQMRLDQLGDALTALQCTPEEKVAIRALANQTLFGTIMQSALPTDPADASHWIAPHCPSSTEQITEYQVSREGGEIRLRALCTLDLAHAPEGLREGQREGQREGKREAVRAMDHVDPVRGKPRPPGRGRIARTP